LGPYPRRTEYHNRGTLTGTAAIVRTVSAITRNRALVLAAGLTGCLAAAGTGAGAATVAPGSTREAAALRTLLRSRDLWATIDVCNPPDQRNYVGIRGSMPADGHARDKMYMSFRLQYMETAGKRWVDLASPKAPVYVFVGAAGSVRQGGRSFQLVPRPGKPAATLRGVVSYQWRRGKKVLQSVTRATTAGHKSLAGADPAGYSAASCVMG
jgi:hypothetical protein